MQPTIQVHTYKWEYIGKVVDFKKESVEGLLEGLAGAKKGVTWIKGDLTLYSKESRGAKYLAYLVLQIFSRFTCVRKYFGINNKQAKSHLLQLKIVVALTCNIELINLYNRAVKQYGDVVERSIEAIPTEEQIPSTDDIDFPLRFEEITYLLGDTTVDQYTQSIATYRTLLMCNPEKFDEILKVDLSAYKEDVADQHLKSVVALASMKELILSGCKNVTDAGLKLLCGLTSLEELDLKGCGVTSTGLLNIDEQVKVYR